MYNCLMRLKILIVDYDEFQVKLLENFIKEYGHDVSATIDAEQAIEQVKVQAEKNNPFDLVLTEFMLTGTTGIALCKKMKAIDKSLTVYLVTADNSTETKRKIAQYNGLNGFISKTAEINELEHHLNVAMSNKKAKLSGEKSEYLKRMKDALE